MSISFNLQLTGLPNFLISKWCGQSYKIFDGNSTYVRKMGRFYRILLQSVVETWPEGTVARCLSEIRGCMFEKKF